MKKITLNEEQLNKFVVYELLQKFILEKLKTFEWYRYAEDLLWEEGEYDTDDINENVIFEHLWDEFYGNHTYEEMTPENEEVMDFYGTEEGFKLAKAIFTEAFKEKWDSLIEDFEFDKQDTKDMEDTYKSLYISER